MAKQMGYWARIRNIRETRGVDQATAQKIYVQEFGKSKQKPKASGPSTDLLTGQTMLPTTLKAADIVTLHKQKKESLLKQRKEIDNELELLDSIAANGSE